MQGEVAELGHGHGSVLPSPMEVVRTHARCVVCGGSRDPQDGLAFMLMYGNNHV